MLGPVNWQRDRGTVTQADLTGIEPVESKTKKGNYYEFKDCYHSDF
jgi:hypothetical protein